MAGAPDSFRRGAGHQKDQGMIKSKLCAPHTNFQDYNDVIMPYVMKLPQKRVQMHFYTADHAVSSRVQIQSEQDYTPIAPSTNLPCASLPCGFVTTFKINW